jgi:beta-glucanase (GH16 family)
MRKDFLLIGCLLLLPVSILTAQSKKFQLIWFDEFNYSGPPDSTKWGYDVGGNGWGNNELEYYTNNRLENARVENGVLIIEARKEEYKGMNYTSARLVTKGKGDWLYGRVEVRAKLPKGRGTWPAIWMLASDWTYGSWPESGEIDIMEHVGYDPDVIHFSTHCLDYYFKIGNQKTATIKMSRTDSLFYTYSLEWYPDRIYGYIDDSLYFTVKNEYLGWRKWPFDKLFHLILNIAVGGGWGAAKGMDDSIWPQKMEVDYVRVYKFLHEKDTIAPSTPTKLEAVATHNRIGLSWQPASDNYGVKEYEIYCDNKLFGKSSRHSFEVKELKPATAYKFRIIALDWENNSSGALEGNFSTTGMVKNIVPGKIEAENFKSEQGTIIEQTTDSLGGYNLGWVEPGDWMEYEIEVKKAGQYSISFRIATGRKNAQIELVDTLGKVICTTPIDNTHRWQTWQTFSSNPFELKAGNQNIKLRITGDRISLNWFEIKSIN